jgi:hypothetical protein
MNKNVPIYVSVPNEFFEKFLAILNENQIKIYMKITTIAHKSENNRVLYKDLEKILCDAKFQKNKLQKELKKLISHGLIKCDSSGEFGDAYYILEDNMHRK